MYLMSGQSLFEVVIALAVITLIIVGIVVLSTVSIRNSSFSRDKNISSKYVQEAVEWLRSERNKSPAQFQGNAVGTYCFNTLSWSNVGNCGSTEIISDTPFQREVVFNTRTLNGKTVIDADVVVFWYDGEGLHESRSSTTFNDLRER